jgi:hypothetical protein
VERCGHLLACAAAQTYFTLPMEGYPATIDHVVESGAPLGIVREQPPPTGHQDFRVLARQVPLPTDNPGPTVYDSVEKDIENARARVERLKREGAAQPEIQLATQHLLRHRLRADRKQLYSTPEFPLEVGALMIGKSCFVSLACEPYAELGVAIKRRSPAEKTIFAGYEGPDVIYVAPSESYAEPRSMEVYNSPFGPGAAQALVEAAVSMLHELHQ